MGDTHQIIPTLDEDKWTMILPHQKLGPHRRHFFQLENVADKLFSHVRVTIYPNGGIKRVRVMGRRELVQPASFPGGDINQTVEQGPDSSKPTT